MENTGIVGGVTKVTLFNMATQIFFRITKMLGQDRWRWYVCDMAKAIIPDGPLAWEDTEHKDRQEPLGGQQFFVSDAQHRRMANYVIAKFSGKQVQPIPNIEITTHEDGFKMVIRNVIGEETGQRHIHKATFIYEGQITIKISRNTASQMAAYLRKLI